MKHTNKHELPFFEDTDKVELDLYTEELASKLDEITSKQNKRIEEQLRNMTLDSPSDAEIVDARGGFNVLRGRLDATDVEINSIKKEMQEVVKVHYIDRGAGTGDCCLIECIDKNVLVDFGNEIDGAKLIQYLTDRNLTKIDYVIISHYHGDHIGGNNAVGLKCVVENSNLDFSSCIFYLPHKGLDYTQFVDTVSKGEKTVINNNEVSIKNIIAENNFTYIEPDVEDILEIRKNVAIRFLNCNPDDYTEYYSDTVSYDGKDVGYTNYNNFSLVAELIYKNNTLLFTGDIEITAQQKIAQHLTNCDVYKVEHHATTVATDNNYLKKIHPKIAVIMNTTETSKLINRRSFVYLNKIAEIFTTNESGNVVVSCDGSNVSAISENGALNYEEIKNDYSLNFPKEYILENGDLDNYADLGTYQCQNGSVAATLLNSPITNAGFKMVVEQLVGGDGGKIIKQTICVHSRDSQTYVRTRYHKTDGIYEWGKWIQLQKVYVDPLEFFGNFNEDISAIIDIINNLPKSCLFIYGIQKNYAMCPSFISSYGGNLIINKVSASRAELSLTDGDPSINKFYKGVWHSNVGLKWYSFTGTEVTS